MTVKVSVSACRDYSPDAVKAAVAEAMASLGGLASFLKPGQSVLVKPNMLSDRGPDEAVTTHPEVVRQVLSALKAFGVKPSVADSPFSGVKTEKVWEKTGIKAACEAEGVPLVSMEKAGSEHVTMDGMTFTIARPVLAADAVINLPKVKTHMLTTLTCAVKNMYGTVPGFQKTALHMKHPTPEEFGRLLAAIYRRVKPVLTIADGVVGMDGEGPSAGRPVRLGFIAASGDGAALDAAVCRHLGITIAAVPYLARVAESGSGEIAEGSIEVVGRFPAIPAEVGAIRMPATSRARLIPGWVVRLLRPFLWIRPVFTEACVKCGRCIAACPAGALSRDESGRPELTPDKCIGCCCCHEVCPEKAVKMRGSPLMRLAKGDIE